MFEAIIVKPIFNALMLLYSIIPGGDFGLAIIIFTIIIRFIMYPLVRRQLRQTRIMRELQPQLAKIKEAAKGNRQLQALQQMELYKRFGVSPFRSILILLVQLPIFIGLYRVILIMTEHRDQLAHYLYAPIRKLDAVGTIISDPSNFNHMFLGFIDITKSAFSNGIDIWLVLLALGSAVTQYIISKQTMPTSDKPKKKFREIMAEAAAGQKADTSDLNASMMGNMVKIMPIFMFFIMVSFPGALALYYTTSNLVAAGQQGYLLRKDTIDLEDIGNEPIKSDEKKSNTKSKQTNQSAKSREKGAKNAQIIRIKAKK